MPWTLPVAPELTAGQPEAYLPGDRRRALAEGRALPDRVRGAALFADISGFTALTQALVEELGGRRGAEELAVTLNRVVTVLIEQVQRRGGEVIYFSGDAITCWFDGDDGTVGVAAGFAMQAALTALGPVTTRDGRGAHPLAMTVAVAVGAARRFVVGDPRIQRIDVLAGALMDRLAEAERLAGRGEVVLAATGHGVVVLEAPAAAADGRADHVRSGAFSGPEPLGRLPEDVVREWLLPAVYERLKSGSGEFLADLRPGVPLFARFGGIDFDNDEGAPQALDEFIVAAQRIVDGCGGSTLQLTLGDKGAYLYAVFGSPVAHEDDAVRACTVALQLLDLPARTSVTDLSVGIASGSLRSGTYGSADRRTFCCLGDAVNVAARLMSAAPAGTAYVTAGVRSSTASAFVWDDVPALEVKGKSAPVPAWSLRGKGEERVALQAVPRGSFVGREVELRALQDIAQRALDGTGQVVAVVGEAGVGKSRLVGEVTRSLLHRGVPVLSGEAQSFGSRASYDPWREMWRQLLQVDARLRARDQLAALERHVRGVDSALVPRLPLLGAVLGISLPDNDLTRGMDAKLRKTSLESLLVAYLAARPPTPLTLVLEDCHWLDTLSRDLLVALTRAIPSLPVLLVLTSRPTHQEAGAQSWLDALPGVPVVELGELPAEQTHRMVTDRLTLSAPARAALLELVVSRCHGNPYYVEELLAYLTHRGIDLDDPTAIAAADLPPSLHSMILSRIDLLGEGSRSTLKVASVVGRRFGAAAVAGSYPELGGIATVGEHLRTLTAVEMVDRTDDAEHLFRHAVLRDVAYESLPYALRTLLHERIGRHLERAATGADVDLLAHHFWLGADDGKKRTYLRLAGQAAAAAFANDAAVDYFERLVPLLAGGERGEVLRELGSVLELSGSWARADEAYVQALDLAEQLGDLSAAAWSRTCRSEIARKQGAYELAHDLLEKAEEDFRRVDDQAGLGQVLHFRGTLLAHRGDNDESREQYLASLAVREQLEDRSAMAAVLSNLAILAEYDGDYPASRELNERAFALRVELQDRWGIGISQNNLGMIALLQHDTDAARRHFEASLRINSELGDAWMVALAHHNLANTARSASDLDGARRSYLLALSAFADFDDGWALANLLEDIAVLACMASEHRSALLLAGAAEGVRDAIGAPRSPAAAETFDDQLAPARLAVSESGDQPERLLGAGAVLPRRQARVEAELVCTTS